MRSIQETLQKIKLSVEVGVGEWGIVIFVVLVAFGSFGLGRLSVLVEKTPVTIGQTASVGQALAIGGQYKAKRGGTYYYFPWCSDAQVIRPEDQVWFKTEAAAQKAGYLPARNCKGMK